MPGVLKIRDENGNFTSINALKGDDGKSAYEQAKDGGYRGTEEEFINFLNGTIGSEDSSHTNDFDNPHNVTAKQVGAVATKYKLSEDLNTELMSGGDTVTIRAYDNETLNSPYKEGLTTLAHGMVITNSHTTQYGTQLCMPSGSNYIFVRTYNKQGVQPWRQIADIKAVNDAEMYAVDYCNSQIAYLEQLVESIRTANEVEIFPAVESLQTEMASLQTEFEQVDFSQLQTKPKLLWTNASPTSTFNGHTIYLSLSSYQFVVIEFGCAAGNTSAYNTQIVRVGGRVVCTYTTRDKIVYSREVQVTTGGVDLQTGYVSTNINNDYQIPLRIWGI